MRLIDADVLKQHIDKLPALPDGNFAGNHSALKALINMQPTIESFTNCSEIQNSSDYISRQAAIDLLKQMRKDGDMIPWEGKDVFARIRKLPSAQPEIIQCKDCKHYEYGICKKAGLCVNKSPNGFCDWGERREVTT